MAESVAALISNRTSNYDDDLTGKRFRRKKGEATEAFIKRIDAAREAKHNAIRNKRAKYAGRKQKYNAKGEHIDGHWFASQAEARRYEQLKELRELDLIDNLELQPSFRIDINNQHICTYRADFAYNIIDTMGSNVRHVVEDVKGMITPEYRLKKKMVEARFSFPIAEIPSRQVTKKWRGCVPTKRANEKQFQPEEIANASSLDD